MRKRIGQFSPTILSLATAYAEQAGGDELIIPESFDGMDYAAVEALYTSAIAQFNEMYDADGSRSPEQIEALAGLTDGIEALAAELATRDEATAERDAQAEALAARVTGLRADTSDEEVDVEDEAEGDTEDEEDASTEDETEDESAAQTIVASGALARREIRVPRAAARRAPDAPAATSPLRSSGEGTGYAVGAELDFLAVGRAIDRKLQGASQGQYQSAFATGRALREQHSIATIERKFASDLMVTDQGPEATAAILDRAADQSRLPQGGLVASGGWCAPSETVYDLLELETRDGMLSLPEVGISRGGLNFTRGPSFGDIFSSITGFAFTEQDDIDGKYEPSAGGNVVGPKPCFHVECPPFEDVRLDVNGLCITAGLLQSRGYPEVIARTVRGALVAHEHRINSLLIQKLVAGSTAVNMGTQVGAAAPILDSIEKQVLHYRYTHRLSLSATLEAVFPAWVFGAIRSDLSRRLGVDLIDVNDQRITAWFTQRGISAQFVYNWQNIDTTAASAFKAWPTTVSFLLYNAGTWVRGSTPIITLDTLYDSTLLANNDFTALFTEEGWLVAKRGFDSRVVSVGIEASGGTHMGVDIAHDGTLVPAT